MKRTCRAHLNEVVRHEGQVLQLASSLRDGRLPCEPPPFFPANETKSGVVGCLEKEDWLKRAKEALKTAASQDRPDDARILCYTNRTLESLVPHARRAIHGDMADQMPVLPGEVLICRKAVMAPASKNGSEVGEEPDLVLSSNRELLVKDVIPEKCDLVDFGLKGESDWDVPVIDTLFAKITAGELELSLRLLPPVGSSSRLLLDETLKRLKEKAKNSEKREGRTIWRKFFLIRDAFASLGPASVLTVHRSQGSSFGHVFVSADVFWPKDVTLRRQLAYVAITRARKSVWMIGNQTISSNKEVWKKELFPETK